jgi:hypothetical protein
MGIPGKRPRRIRRREAERLLRGRSVTGPADPGRREVAHVLRAATAPPLPEEVAGEEAAVALFRRQYDLGRTAPARAPSWLSRRRPRRVMVMRLAVAFGVLLLGGVATGAETGLLPAALQQRAHSLFSSFGVPPPTAGPSTGHSDQPQPGVTPSGASEPPGVTASGSPYPKAAVGWCHSYDNGNGKLSAKELADLSAAAGGTNKIASFCAEVLRAAASAAPGAAATTPPVDHPGHPSKPAKTHGPPSPRITRR